jgi:hypothetical protein
MRTRATQDGYTVDHRRTPCDVVPELTCPSRTRPARAPGGAGRTIHVPGDVGCAEPLGRYASMGRELSLAQPWPPSPQSSRPSRRYSACLLERENQRATAEELGSARTVSRTARVAHTVQLEAREQTARAVAPSMGTSREQPFLVRFLSGGCVHHRVHVICIGRAGLDSMCQLAAAHQIRDDRLGARRSRDARAGLVHPADRLAHHDGLIGVRVPAPGAHGLVHRRERRLICPALLQHGLHEGRCAVVRDGGFSDVGVGSRVESLSWCGRRGFDPRSLDGLAQPGDDGGNVLGAQVAPSAGIRHSARRHVDGSHARSTAMRPTPRTSVGRSRNS